MNQKTNIIIGGLLVSLGIILGILGTTLSDNFIQKYIYTTTTKPDETIEDYLSEVIKERSYYYQNDELLFEGALSGMVGSLGDAYSTYFSEEAYQDYTNHLNDTMYGIGVAVVLNGPYPMINYVYEGSPALTAGFEKGHTIKTVDGVDLYNKTIPEITGLIKGVKGTTRMIGVYTDNPDVVTNISVTTDLITSSTINYDYVNVNNHKIGYLQIETFASPTYDELLVAMTHLESKEIDDLIIDVRNNPGGLLTSVTNILDYFINTEEPFMYAKSRDEVETKYYINENNHEINYNIVVLMNENSASASEIFAATMHEIGNYQLFGKTTYGKGTMQNAFPLNIERTSVVKLTTHIWLTPNKEWIHGIGVDPSIEVEQTSYEGISYINSYQLISFDQVNEEIKDVQIFLNKKGFTTRLDGYFDDDTREAVRTYQFTKGLEDTGIVDHKTAYQLNLDIMNFYNNKIYDNQYQFALNNVLNN